MALTECPLCAIPDIAALIRKSKLPLNGARQLMYCCSESCQRDGVLPTIRSEIKVGDIVEAGIEFRNGEIGNCRFEGWPLGAPRCSATSAKFV